MVAQPVLKIGNQQLIEASQVVTEFDTPAMRQLLKDMLETMRAMQGVGIAAPQIGVPQRVIMLGFEKNARYPHAKPIPLTVLVNPKIIRHSQELVEGWEGCLSVTGMRGLVPRYQEITVQAQNEFGEALEFTATDFHARVLQHEIDHINGVLYPHRIKDMRCFGFEPDVFAMMENHG